MNERQPASQPASQSVSQSVRPSVRIYLLESVPFPLPGAPTKSSRTGESVVAVVGVVGDGEGVAVVAWLRWRAFERSRIRRDNEFTRSIFLLKSIF